MKQSSEELKLGRHVHLGSIADSAVNLRVRLHARACCDRCEREHIMVGPYERA